MEQIAAEADVSKGTLYNHFPSKEAVLAHWIHAQLEQDLSQLQPEIAREASFAPALSLLLDASATWCEQHRDFLAPYLRFRLLSFESASGAEDDADGNASSDLIDGFAWLIARGQRAGELRDDIAPAHLASLFHHLYLGALMRWLTTADLDLRSEFAVVIKLFIDGAIRS